MAQEVFDSGALIILAHVQPFRLGAVEIYPSTRQIMLGSVGETIEPRVMQVLTALAQAGGAVVTSDELIARCWDGRIVGENAIHRVISRVRHIAATLGNGAFGIETIAKVGYRLTVEGASAPAAVRPPAQGRRLSLIVPLAATLVAFGLLGAVSLWRWGDSAAPLAKVAIFPAEGNVEGESAALARSLLVDLHGLPVGRTGTLALIEPTATGRDAAAADYQVRVSTERAGGRLRADLSLAARADSRALWSASLEGASAGLADLRQQAAATLGAVLVCLGDGIRPGPGRLDPATLQLYLTSCGKAREEIDEAQVRRLRQVTARAPAFARGWADLALAEALALPDGPAEAVQRANAIDHIRQARALDPNLGETYIAEAQLIDEQRRWGDRLRLYDRGIACDPDFVPLHAYRSFELTRVGRMQEAVASARRAVALDPLSIDDREALVSGLAYSGQRAAAFAELERAERVWPGTRAMRALRYRMELRFGDPRAALRFHDQPDLFDMLNPPTDRSWEAFLRARIDPSPANVQHAVDVFAARHPALPMGLLQTLGHFGRVDEAYRVMAPSQMLPLIGTEVLFRPQMRSVRNDPRFIALAARLGLLAYWQNAGIWPDFCLDPALPYDCRAEAAKLAPSRRAGGRTS